MIGTSTPSVLPGPAAGRAAGHEQAEQHRQELHHLADRVDQQHPRVEPLPFRVRSQLGHVASPSTASAFRVSSSTSRCASALSRPSILSAPAADAVVTVTVARPKSRDSAPSA